MKRRPFRQIDVFSVEPFRGNPLAVVLDGEGLDEARMQQFARWSNLSETTFVLPPTDPAADYRVRIFTPGAELPFAGHPTLGTCHAWLAAGGRPRREGMMVQQCGIGFVQVRRDGHALAFEAPPLRRSAVDAAVLAQVMAALGADAARLRAAQWLDNGPQWLGLLFDHALTVLALEPDHAALKALPKVGVIAPHPAGAEGPAFEVRAFAPSIGVAEDPVTGSLNASLAQWLIAEGVAPQRYMAAQGACLGRAGRVHIEQRDGQVWVGGASVICIEGHVTI